MGKKHLFLSLLAVLAVFILLVGSVSAHDMDLEHMDNEQLLQLLQMIMDRLNETESSELSVEESTPEPTVMVTAEAPSAEHRTFSIYKLKKLMIEAIPSYMFIPKDTGESGEKTDDGGGKKPGLTPTPTLNPDIPDCGPGCKWTCPDVYELPCSCVCH